MRIRSNLLVLHQNSFDPYLLVTSAWLLQLGNVAKGLIYMHDQGMIHGDLKGVRLIKLDLDASLQRHSSFRVIYWSMKLAMPALRILGLRVSLTQQFRIYAYKAAPSNG